jgi:hypothetical protein
MGPDLRIIPTLTTPTTLGSSVDALKASASDLRVAEAKIINEVTIDGLLPSDGDDEPPKPPHDGGVALPAPEEPERNEVWEKALVAFVTASEDMSRAARHIQMIRHPLESLARDIKTMTGDLSVMSTQFSLLRENLTPPIAVQTATAGTILVQHVGPIVTQLIAPGLWARFKWLLWHITRAVVVTLAGWSVLQLLGTWWPPAAALVTWLSG